MVDLPEKIERKLEVPIHNVISVGISWVDGRLVFKKDSKWSQAWYGICHYQFKVFSVFPIDYFNCTQIKTVQISLAENYCEKAGSCLNFDCVSAITGKKINMFNRFLLAAEFKDVGPYSLGLPQNLGTETLWFNKASEHGDWPRMWKRLIEPYTPDGVVLQYNEYKDIVKAD